MHDWWLALAASAFGHIARVDEATILYRQHGANDSGAHRYGAVPVLKHLAQRTASLLSGHGFGGDIHFEKAVRQARAFAERFAPDLDPHRAGVLAAYASIDRLGFWRRRLFLIQNGILKARLLMNIGLMFKV